MPKMHAPSGVMLLLCQFSVLISLFLSLAVENKEDATNDLFKSLEVPSRETQKEVKGAEDDFDGLCNSPSLIINVLTINHIIIFFIFLFNVIVLNCSST